MEAAFFNSATPRHAAAPAADRAQAASDEQLCNRASVALCDAAVRISPRATFT
jgi:hypothetical protein